MRLEKIAQNAKQIGRKALLASLLVGSLSLGSCIIKEVHSPTEPGSAPAEPSSPSNPQSPTNPSQTYNNVTGSWNFSSSSLSNDKFSGGLSANLNLTQTTQLLPGYSTVYKITGNFNELGWLFQRKSNGEGYIFEHGSGSIINGGINTDISGHNLEFDLASTNFHVRGVAPAYESMWGDITMTINMTAVYGTSDGTITLTGNWNASRQ
jgi:hypothetical protein